MSKVVLGGGIGGLSAAYYLARKFPTDKVTLIEASSRTGGWIKSNLHENVVFEEAPRTIRPFGFKGANTLQLVEELGLGSEILSLTRDDPAVQNRMVYVNKELYSLPSSFKSLFSTQPPFSKPFIYYLLREITRPKKFLPDCDESIYSFVERRFGREIADYAIAPLICGICAGDAREISVNLLMSEMFEYEQKYGNITTGLICNAFKKAPQHSPTGSLYKCAKSMKWSIYTFKNGLETFVKRLESVVRCNTDIHLNSPCTAIEIQNNNVILHTDSNQIMTEHLLSCVPANVLHALIKGHPKLSLLLNNIPFVTVGVVNLHYNCNLEYEGFGFLIPPQEKLPILGVIFDSCVYPCGPGIVLTVMLGGSWFNEYFGHNPHKELILDTAIKQVSNTLGIKDMPDKYLVNIHKNCIPQYIVGHSALIKEINNYIARYELPLTLCGASYNGVGINDVIWNSRMAITKFK